MTDDPINPGSSPDGEALDLTVEWSATAPADASTGAPADTPDSPTKDTSPRRSRRSRSARDPLAAHVEAELSMRRRVVAVRLSEVEHLAWRRETAADKRGQVGAWTRSVVGAEIARRQGADVPDTATENPTGGGAVVVRWWCSTSRWSAS